MGPLPLAPVTLISQWRIKNAKRTHLNERPSRLTSGWEGTTQSKPRGQIYVAMTQMRMRKAITRWPMKNLPVNYDY